VGLIWRQSWALPVRAGCRVSFEIRPSGALIDEIAIGRRCETDADPEQRIEGTAHVSPPVPAEYELVEIVNRPGFPRGLFVQNSGGFFKSIHLCMEFVLQFLRRPMAIGAV